MDNLSHGRIIGIDVCRDWLDLHCLPDGLQLRMPNGPEGHAAVADLARNQDAVVCFESTGGQEWQLWETLEAEGVNARQVSPAQVKSFTRSRGTRAKTDRIDAELIARFFAFRPDAGRRLPTEKLRLLSLDLEAGPDRRDAQTPFGADPCASEAWHSPDV